MTLFRNKYRIETTRRVGWDYSLPGGYFVTAITKNRIPYFGKIIQAEVIPSPLGECAIVCWNEIPKHHPNVTLDEFIIMPNHMHGIILISGPERLPQMRKPGEVRRLMDLKSAHFKASSVSSVMASFKGTVTRWSEQHQFDFAWQPRFHDRIVRGKNSLKAVREYIRDNPKNWEKDPEFVVT